MPGTHQNIQYLGGGGLYGNYTAVGGGGVPVARSEMDFLRMGVGRAPQAEYPDGYLGTIRTRRDDRGRPNSVSETMLDSMKQRMGQRNYQRGVHKGERVDPSNYYYPSTFEPDRGLKRQARGKQIDGLTYVKRHTESATLAPAPHLPNDGKANLRSTSPLAINDRRVASMKRLRPAWV